MTWKDQRNVLALARGVWRHVAAASLVRILVAAGRIGLAMLVAGILRGALEGRGVQTELTVGLAVWLCVQFGIDAASPIVAQKVAAATKQRLRARLFAKLGELGPGLLGGERTGKMQAALVSHIEALETYFSECVPALAVACVIPLAICLRLGARAPELGAMVFAFALGAAILPALFKKPQAKRSKERMTAYLDLGAEFLDTVQGMVTLKMFGASGRRRRELAVSSDRVATQGIRELFVALAHAAIVALMTVGGFAATITLASHYAAAGRIDGATLFLALFLTREALRPFADLLRATHASMSAASAAEEIHTWLAMASPAPASARPVAAPDGALSVEFDGVSFAYVRHGEPVLRNVSFRVNPGEMLALIGPSGAGKTTALSLLLRFVAPQRGRVLVGGIDTRDMKPDALRARMAVVSQDTYLFAGTVRENLMLARPGASPAAVEAAARAAAAHDFIVELPHGYDTALGEQGLRLSGGQRQRLALARAFLKDAPILVLDEPTANLDTTTEAAILQALEELSRGKTTILVTHRLSSLSNLPSMRERGRILELATPEPHAADREVA